MKKTKNTLLLIIGIIVAGAIIYYVGTQLTSNNVSGNIDIPTNNDVIEIPTDVIDDGAPDLS